VRRKPNRQALPKVARLYQEMLNTERQAGSRNAVEASTKILQHELDNARVSYREWVLNLQTA
jgi:hypothetical protein